MIFEAKQFGKHLKALNISKSNLSQNFGFGDQNFGKNLKAPCISNFDRRKKFQSRKAFLHRKSRLLEGRESEVLWIISQKMRKVWLSSPRIVLSSKVRKFVLLPKDAQYEHRRFKIPPQRQLCLLGLSSKKFLVRTLDCKLQNIAL